jgi:hypothetical protein
VGIMNSCAKCGAVVCACGFAATLEMFVLGGGEPPPDHAAAPLASAPPIAVGPTGPAGTHFLNMPDQISGWDNLVVWPGGKERGAAFGPTGPTGSHREVASGRVIPTGTTGPAGRDLLREIESPKGSTG